MANVKSAAKRSRQEAKRTIRNSTTQSATRSILKKAIVALKNQDAGKAKEAYTDAVSALQKAGGKGFMPTRRAARKISRLTRLFLKTLPEALPFQATKVKSSKKAEKTV